jgi:hypothetical protein
MWVRQKLIGTSKGNNTISLASLCKLKKERKEKNAIREEAPRKYSTIRILAFRIPLLRHSWFLHDVFSLPPFFFLFFSIETTKRDKQKNKRKQQKTVPETDMQVGIK